MAKCKKALTNYLFAFSKLENFTPQNLAGLFNDGELTFKDTYSRNSNKKLTTS